MKSAHTIKRMKPLLGTFVEVAFTDDESVELNQNTLFAKAFSAIESIQNEMSFHNPDSALSKLNLSQGEWIVLPSSLIKLLKRGQSLYQKSDGLFNFTVGGFLVNRGFLPNHFDHKFDNSGSPLDIEIKGQKARLRKPVLITLDGIAKGFAVDQAISVLQDNVNAGWVNAGGDIRVFGDVILPIHQRNAITIKYITDIENSAIATSQIQHNAKKDFPSHIINLQGRQPVECTISVKASKAYLADSLTKILAFYSEKERYAIAQRFNATYLHPNN